MGLFYTIYKGNISRGLVKDIYEGSIYMTQGTSEDYIGLRPKVYNNILGGLYSKTKNPNSDFNSILSTNR